MKFKKIKKAVFPVAGLGTRFLPATKACPKEMLPVVDKPLIQYAVEEAVQAGITDMIFITGRSKRAIEDHFDRASELEQELQNKSEELLSIVKNIPPKGINCIFIRQPEALGLGHAVSCAYPAIGDQPFAVLLADDLMEVNSGNVGVMSQMVNEYQKIGKSLVALQEVLWEDTNKYGIVDSEDNNNNLKKIKKIVEKPETNVAPSNTGVVGRYILDSKIFPLLNQQKKGSGGEIQLTDAISDLIKLEEVYGYKFVGERFDCGSKQGYLRATVSFGLKHHSEGNSFTSWMKQFDF